MMLLYNLLYLFFSFEYPTNQKMIPITSHKNDFDEEFAKFALYIISYYTLTSSLCNNVWNYDFLFYVDQADP